MTQGATSTVTMKPINGQLTTIHSSVTGLAIFPNAQGLYTVDSRDVTSLIAAGFTIVPTVTTSGGDVTTVTVP